jgi:excisionase family DNA binding protein
MTSQSDDCALLVSVCEAARRLSIGRTRTFELLSTGELESVRVGSRRLVPVSALETFVERLRSGVRA